MNMKAVFCVLMIVCLVVACKPDPFRTIDRNDYPKPLYQAGMAGQIPFGITREAFLQKNSHMKKHFKITKHYIEFDADDYFGYTNSNVHDSYRFWFHRNRLWKAAFAFRKAAREKRSTDRYLKRYGRSGGCKKETSLPYYPYVGNSWFFDRTGGLFINICHERTRRSYSGSEEVESLKHAPEDMVFLEKFSFGDDVRRRVRVSYQIHAGYDRSEMKKFMKGQSYRMYKCYKDGIFKEPGLEGKVVVIATLRGVKAAPASVRLEKGLSNEAINSCLVGLVRSWKIPETLTRAQMAVIWNFIPIPKKYVP